MDDGKEYLEKVTANLCGVLDRIRTASAGRDVTLLLATKTVSADAINKLSRREGSLLIGENKVQELLQKYDELEKERLDIHFIGHLQTNKVKYIIDKVSMIHSVDRYELACEISKRAKAKGIVMPVLVEINIAKEDEKGGVYPEDAQGLIESISELDGIKVMGLMTMAPARISAQEYVKYFTQTKELFERIKAIKPAGVSMEVLSMGMSDSYEQAVQCGATMVRVGSAVFGKRIYPEQTQADMRQ